MDNIEVMVSDIIFVFLKQKEKKEWNILLELVLNKEEEKIIPCTLNNYSKITLKEDSEKGEYIEQVIKCLLNQSFIARELIKANVLNIYKLNKGIQKIKF